MFIIYLSMGWNFPKNVFTGERTRTAFLTWALYTQILFWRVDSGPLQTWYFCWITTNSSILTQPLSNSYAVTPSDHQSTGYEYPGPPSIKAWNTSGAKIVNQTKQKSISLRLDYEYYFTAEKWIRTQQTGIK